MSEKPNIVFILTDDQAIWAAGCYGNPEIRTPNIDALAARGTRIENFFVASPVCSPSRATYLTGKINSQHGVHDWIRRKSDGTMPARLLEGEVTYTDVLSANGWTCGISGKWHLGLEELGEHGFSHSFIHRFGGGNYKDPPMIRNGVSENATGYVTDLITDEALSFIDTGSQREEPFYLSVHYTAPHSPWYGHPQDIMDSYDDCPFESCPQEPPHPWMAGSPTEFKGGRELLKGYFAATTAMDANVGRIVARLIALGIEKNTLVIFVSDNGFNFGHHGIWGKGNGTYPFNMFETSVRVPAIFCMPGSIREDAVLSGLYSAYDILPTLLDFVDLPVPPDADLPGQSFAPALRGADESQRNSVMVFDEFGGTRMIRTPEWKYVHRYDAGYNELYDMVNDPGERRNLISEPQQSARIAAMRISLEQWFDRYADPSRDGKDLGITGFGQIDRLTGTREIDRRSFAQSWWDSAAGPAGSAPSAEGGER